MKSWSTVSYFIQHLVVLNVLKYVSVFFPVSVYEMLLYFS